MWHPDSMYYVGEFYRQGILVEKNIDTAFEWYLKSAITEQYTTVKKKEFFHWMPYDKFENIEEIGKGAFSTVFKTNYLNRNGSNEQVAIKIVKDSNKNKEQFLKENEFIKEIIAELDKKWNIGVNESEIKTEKQFLGDIIKNFASRTKKQFLESDEISKNFSVLTEKLKNMYTSKPYNITDICTRLSKMGITKSASIIEVPDDI
ncbi:putative Non-specific protein-tyrosine kinase [Gigaspora margarita]|uniref:Putative Non-specific protein-tyrosine kinase n=1 Tax=Gigaspora margarita TaxID=4874 RepID=A0A8H4AEE2_GIGMA|nr:putative Non-specific protein-tyrosine kinase [Gigaspora margarita]